MLHQDRQKSRRDETSNKRSRSRSRSLQRDKKLVRDVKRPRSQSPDCRRHSSDKHTSYTCGTNLPSSAPHLDKHDFKQYRGIFADYLDVQKGLNINKLSDHEVKGRWKSFLKKWNNGTLAVGWYGPERLTPYLNVTLRKDIHGTESDVHQSEAVHDSVALNRLTSNTTNVNPESHGGMGEDDSDEIGPTPPSTFHDIGNPKASGPAIPNLSDLQYAREIAAEDREAYFSNLRAERKQDRKLQKERIEELAPRSDPGSRERQLEKKREFTAANRAFKNAKESGDIEVDDGDLMGDDGEDGFKRRLKDTQRKKTEREVKREEMLLARRAERDERLKAHREKEEKILAGFKELVKAKYG